jgi:hypothetical protein
MKSLLVLLAATLSASVVLAEPSRHPKSRTATPSGRPLPLKGAASANSCAAYGAGFVRIEGSDTCIKIGGAIGIGGGVSSGSR